MMRRLISTASLLLVAASATACVPSSTPAPPAVIVLPGSYDVTDPTPPQCGVYNEQLHVFTQNDPRHICVFEADLP